MPADTQPLPPELADFIASGLSITVASCGARRVPSIAKAVGCSVGAQRSEVTVLLFADQAEAVLRDVAAGGGVAVCFNRPSTHQTVQLKGDRVRSEPAPAALVPVARRCLDLLIDDLLPMGFERRMLETFFWRDLAQLQALTFAPSGAFAQTPGPDAGSAIAVHRPPPGAA
jgi:hypothetical protein